MYLLVRNLAEVLLVPVLIETGRMAFFEVLVFFRFEDWDRFLFSAFLVDGRAEPEFFYANIFSRFRLDAVICYSLFIIKSWLLHLTSLVISY